MSAFLGPIHIKMYNRVLYQDEMSQNILSAGEENGWAQGLRTEADSKAPAASREPLDTLIDQSNIHGWLNAAVACCETRFAVIVSGILNGHRERLGELQAVMKDMGRQYVQTGLTDAEQAFRVIHDILLDGMPCDFPFNVTESGADKVVWQVTNCPHLVYWKTENFDVENYYLLRDAWVEGMLEAGGVTHTRSGGVHTLLIGV